MQFPKIILSCLALFAGAQIAHGHCQVPCGIFDDAVKFSELEQHVETIAKAAGLVKSLSEKEEKTAHDMQQIVRWTVTKEEHAAKIIDEAANYFLAQRVKVGADHYAQKIELLHHIIVFSMKTKQAADSAATEPLAEKIAAFKALYLDHDHSHAGHSH